MTKPSTFYKSSVLFLFFSSGSVFASNSFVYLKFHVNLQTWPPLASDLHFSRSNRGLASDHLNLLQGLLLFHCGFSPVLRRCFLYWLS